MSEQIKQILIPVITTLIEIVFMTILIIKRIRMKLNSPTDKDDTVKGEEMITTTEKILKQLEEKLTTEELKKIQEIIEEKNENEAHKIVYELHEKAQQINENYQKELAKIIEETEKITINWKQNEWDNYTEYMNLKNAEKKIGKGEEEKND